MHVRARVCVRVRAHVLAWIVCVRTRGCAQVFVHACGQSITAVHSRCVCVCEGGVHYWMELSCILFCGKCGATRFMLGTKPGSGPSHSAPTHPTNQPANRNQLQDVLGTHGV